MAWARREAIWSGIETAAADHATAYDGGGRGHSHTSSSPARMRPSRGPHATPPLTQDMAEECSDDEAPDDADGGACPPAAPAAPAPAPAAPALPECPYGARCYRMSAEHRAQYAHNTSGAKAGGDAKGAEKPAAAHRYPPPSPPPLA